MKRVHAIRPEIDPDALLPGAQFIDAFNIAVEGAMPAMLQLWLFLDC